MRLPGSAAIRRTREFRHRAVFTGKAGTPSSRSITLICSSQKPKIESLKWRNDRANLIVRIHRRDLVWINVTANPTAEWVARQITEAFPWDGAARYMIRDRDRIYGTVVTRRLRAMGIRDKPIAPASPWQNGFAERLLDRSGASAWTTSLSSARRICAGF